MCRVEFVRSLPKFSKRCTKDPLKSEAFSCYHKKETTQVLAVQLWQAAGPLDLLQIRKITCIGNEIQSSFEKYNFDHGAGVKALIYHIFPAGTSNNLNYKNAPDGFLLNPGTLILARLYWRSGESFQCEIVNLWALWGFLVFADLSGLQWSQTLFIFLLRYTDVVDQKP